MTTTKRYHFIGIGGIGMSGLARILLIRNQQVSGSDVASSELTQILSQDGAKIFHGHSAQHISKDMTVIYSSGIKADNPEYQAAIQMKCPILHRSDLLQMIMQDHKSLAVAGTHGKTTTTAILTSVLIEAGLDPSYAVGGLIPQLESNAGYGEGEFFVVEADESDGTFLKYKPFGAIVTNIDNDHLDHFETEENITKAFGQFIESVEDPHHLFWCGDDAELASLKPIGQSYGFGPKCQWRILSFKQDGWKVIYDLQGPEKKYTGIELSLTGRHNALNSAAVFALALSLNISEDSIRRAFRNFGGVKRRCEKKGEISDILFLDDYAHHPTEIQTTLSAIRQAIGERRLIIAYQPHRYTRTRDCLGSFGKIFDEADLLYVTDIYAAGESPIAGVTHHQVIEEIKAVSNVPCKDVERWQLSQTLAAQLRPHDVLVTIGAGDITKVSQEVLNLFKVKPPIKLKAGVVFGGRSCEHEISILSARHVYGSLNPDYYEIQTFGITKNGQWKIGLDPNAITTVEKGEALNGKIFDAIIGCDVLFPVLHGPYGEDGTIQGFFEMLDKAYVGCDCCSAAISMDKVLTKKLAMSAGVQTSPYVDFSKTQWKTQSAELLKEINEKLHYPVFVKPSHLGSSIGVKKVENPEALPDAIDAAFNVDTHILVENGIKGREIEFAVLGNDTIQAFAPGEILTGGKVYDYEAKYSTGGFATSPKADLPDVIAKIGQELAIQTFKAVDGCGMARIDFFLDEKQQFWLNEVNPIPGFTSISLYPKMCESSGLGSKALMDRLIILALQKRRERDRIG